MKKNLLLFNIFVIILSFVLFIVPAGAEDLVSSVPDLDEPYFEPEIHTIVSYDGTTLFEDLIIDDEIVLNPYFNFMAEVISNAFPLYVNVPGASTQYIFINKDRECEISFLKNYYEGELMHGIKVSTYYDDGTPLEYLYFYNNMSIDTYQGFVRGNWPNNLWCRPSYNVALPSGLPAYTAEEPQVYFTDYYEPEDYTLTDYFTYYAVPTYAGRFTLRDWETGGIYESIDTYLGIGDKYQVTYSHYVTDTRLFYTTFSAENSVFSSHWKSQYINLSDGVGFSKEAGSGPVYLYYDYPSDVDSRYTYGNTFPKYYSEKYSDIRSYLMSSSQYQDYLVSDQKVIDDLDKSKAEYEQSSEELADAIQDLNDIPKPDISHIDLTVNQDAQVGIAQFSDIIAVIFSNALVLQMLMISLTFILVAYILFGKR